MKTRQQLLATAVLLAATAVFLTMAVPSAAAGEAGVERLRGTAERGPRPDVPGGLRSFPSSPSVHSALPQRYDVEYRFVNRDIGGTTLSSTLITADYTRSLEGGDIRWNDVRVAAASGGSEAMGPGEQLTIMEGFQYGVSEKIVEESFYDGFPSGDLRDLIKTMVWDGMLIEMFTALAPGFEQLQLNRPQHVADYEGFLVQMCDWGTILMRDLDVEWSGVSMVNDEPCAVVIFQSFSNPVDSENMFGRSCYWGQVWFSTIDLDIERLTMNEDVVLEMAIPETSPVTMNIQRQVEFTKQA